MATTLHCASVLGVGIDLAERSAFAHLDDGAIRRAADRWLGPGERAWCAERSSFREAMVVVLSCKEAVFKARGASIPPHEIPLTLHGRGASGWAASEGLPYTQAVAWWRFSPRSVLSVAAAAPEGCPRPLVARAVARLVRGLPRRAGWPILPRRRDTPADLARHDPAVAGPTCGARTG